MSIATAIENLSARVQDAYTALSAKGATMPAVKNTANLSATVESLQGQNLSIHTMSMVTSTYDVRTRAGYYYYYKKKFQPSNGYVGISNLSVQFKTRLSLSVKPSTTAQKIFPDSGTVGWDVINVPAVTYSIDSNIKAENIKQGVTILGVTGTHTGGVTPSGTFIITNNGTYDVANYASANVDVQSGTQQGYTVTYNMDGSYNVPFVVIKSDGTQQTLYAGSGTVNDVVVLRTNYDDGYGNNNPYPDSTGWTSLKLYGNLNITFHSICLLKGTPVNLWNGKTKPIQDITYDDQLLCWDFDKGELAPAKPFWIKKAQTNGKYWVNRFASGRKILTTGTVAGHRFFDISKGGFKYNTECLGDDCHSVDGPDRLVECRRVDGECEFYNVYTSYHMNFFADGILTGFRYCNLYPFDNMKYVKDGRPLRSRAEFNDIPYSWFHGMRCDEQTDSAYNIAKYVFEREIIKA